MVEPILLVVDLVRCGRIAGVGQERTYMYEGVSGVFKISMEPGHRF